MRRQQLEAAVQAVHRLVSVITVQHVLHRALNSAVTALDAQAEASKEPLQKRKPDSGLALSVEAQTALALFRRLGSRTSRVDCFQRKPLKNKWIMNLLLTEDSVSNMAKALKNQGI